MVISTELSQRIEDELREFVSKNEPHLLFDDQIDLRKIAADQNILPVILDMGGCYAIRPNGEVVSFVWDEPYTLQVESDQNSRNTALFAATQKYRKLAELLPVRSSDSVECSYCKGTGRYEELSKHGIDPDAIRCYCGGLGWLPASKNVAKP